MIGSFDELLLRCHDAGTRDRIAEAIECYQSSAYRASIVSAYIAMCFDLIAKLRELSSDGDAEATSKVAEMDRMQDQLACNDPQAIGRLLEFERNLLELFRDKFDFFGVDEFDHLARLRHDRNRCAHPTFTKTNEPFRPTAELARRHIRNVVEYVISQPPKQGKAALDSLREVVLSTYFPSSHAARIERLRRTALGNPRPALTRAFVDELIFGFAKPEDKYFREGVVLGLIKVLIEMHRSDALERAVADTNKLLAEAGDEAVKAGVRIVLTVHEVGERIDALARFSHQRAAPAVGRRRLTHRGKFRTSGSMRFAPLDGGDWASFGLRIDGNGCAGALGEVSGIIGRGRARRRPRRGAPTPWRRGRAARCG